MVAKSFVELDRQLPPEFKRAAAVRLMAHDLFAWALSHEYRAVRTRAGQVVHRRFEGHTLAELEAKIKELGPEVEQAVKAMPAYRACVAYLCPDEHRPGVPVAA